MYTDTIYQSVPVFWEKKKKLEFTLYTGRKYKSEYTVDSYQHRGSKRH